MVVVRVKEKEARSGRQDPLLRSNKIGPNRILFRPTAQAPETKK